MRTFYEAGLEACPSALAITTRAHWPPGAYFDELQRDGTDPLPVANYPSARLEPLIYPGARPSYSFAISPDAEVLPISAQEQQNAGQAGVQFAVSTERGAFAVDDVLRHYEVASMEDRVPVVGFGSNACPGQLVEKFKATTDADGNLKEDFFGPADNNDRLIVPTARGTIRDLAAVYSSKLGIRGYVFAEVTPEEGIETEVFVNFLSPDQLRAMKKSEGAYTLCNLGVVALEGLERPFSSYGFAGKNKVLLNEEGQPILLDSVRASQTGLPKMSEIEVLAMMADRLVPDLQRIYPFLPIDEHAFAAADQTTRAHMLSQLMLRRTEFVRRPDTEKTHYKYHPEPGQAPDPLFGTAIIDLLTRDKMVATANVLESLPDEHIDVTPRTFGELYKETRLTV